MASKKVKKKNKNKQLAKALKLKKRYANGPQALGNINGFQSLVTFSQVRESYFNYLQNVIRENLVTLDSGDLPNEILETISLEIEQQALLACMKSAVYQRIMVKIIRNIRKSTQKMKLHLGIKNIMYSKNLKGTDVLQRLKIGEEKNEQGRGEAGINTEVYSQIPTISSSRPDYDVYNLDWEDENALDDECSLRVPSINGFTHEDDLFPSKTNHGSSLEAQDLVHNVYSSATNEQYLSVYPSNSSDFTSSNILPAETQALVDSALESKENGTYVSQNLVPLTESNFVEHLQNRECNRNSTSLEPSINKEKVQTVHKDSPDGDPISRSRTQLQRSVENLLKTLNDIKTQQKEERDRAVIAKILEDDTEDNAYDSLSDNCDETINDHGPEDKNQNLLADRLEEMKQIFGVEEEEEEEKVVKDSTKMNGSSESQMYGRKKKNRHAHTWYHERVIQMHKLSLLMSETNEDMKNRNRSLFLELFGEDSDEENEIEFYGEERYLASCKERISSWVVKYLMPFYHKRRIVGRNVFKSLGHRVSNFIIEQIQYPDEWTVKYFVTKFFPSGKRFVTESEVSLFLIE